MERFVTCLRPGDRRALTGEIARGGGVRVQTAFSQERYNLQLQTSRCAARYKAQCISDGGSHYTNAASVCTASFFPVFLTSTVPRFVWHPPPPAVPVQCTVQIL